MSQKTEKKLDLNSIYNNNDNPLPLHLSSERKISESLVREFKFKELFAASIVDVEKLKKLAWDGAPRGKKEGKQNLSHLFQVSPRY